MVHSLKVSEHELSDPAVQLEVLNGHSERLRKLPDFEEKLRDLGEHPLRPTGIEIFQVNLGYMCNMTCKHCHVDAGPDREEVMPRAVMDQCLQALEGSDISTVDLTGGAPEMHPRFRWFVEELAGMDRHVIVRSNLTILTTAPKYRSLPEFFARHGVEVTCSLPFYNREHTDRQRGEGTYVRSVEALKHLNEIGYGVEGSGLELNLVYNPAGAFLPGSQEGLEREFRERLKTKHDITFNNLFTITNLPISRYLKFLLESGNLDDYMEKLVAAFNPAAARGVMCRNTISVSWEGYLHDCDFNQMLEMKVEEGAPRHISGWDEQALNARAIRTDRHCYGCTAGAGSSCGGEVA
ncbi:MAG: arsenosugar biosynthesis radical SAM (seleno)protein ArsS [Balneolaceae bacterium]|nr:arsenosugar biosynthesis radical SAM (seleno)protein ArsS [Balneolaceae bacterium]